MTKSLGNICVKTTDFEKVKTVTLSHLKSLKDGKMEAFVSQPVGDYVLVFPDPEFGIIFELAKTLSKELNTPATAGFTYNSKDTYLKCYKNDELFFSYMWDILGKFQDSPTISPNLNVLRENFSISDTFTDTYIEQLLTTQPTVDTKYEELIRLLGLPEFLCNWGYHLIYREHINKHLSELIAQHKLPELELVSAKKKSSDGE